jgi:hypothetical protein
MTYGYITTFSLDLLLTIEVRPCDQLCSDAIRRQGNWGSMLPACDDLRPTMPTPRR